MSKRKRTDDLDDILSPELGVALDDINSRLGDQGEKGKSPKKKAKVNSKKEDSPIPVRRNEFHHDGLVMPAPRENVIEKRTMIEKIRAWERTFPKELEFFFKDKDPEKLNIEELDEMLDEVKFIVGTKQSGNLSTWIPQAALAITEDILVNYTPIKAHGLVMLGQDPAFQQACKEIALDYTTLTYIPPEYRIGFMVVNAIYMLDQNARNNQDPKKPESSFTGISPEMQKEIDEHMSGDSKNMKSAA